MKYEKRITKLIDNFPKEGIDTLLVTGIANVRYLSGYRGEDASLLLSKRKRFLVTDSRYELQAKMDTRNFEIRLVNGSYFQLISDLAKETKTARLGFEYTHLPYGQYDQIKKLPVGAELVPVFKLVEGLRMIKDADEVELIKDSISVLREAVFYFESILRPQMTESALVAEMEYFVKARSQERAPFGIIVASGSNSALPHARPTARAIKPKDKVLLDLGVDLDGYKSDLTRMFFLGKIDTRSRKIYNIVKEAQRRSIKAIRPGVDISDIDRIARSFICRKGFGDFFGHALGHGVGLEVHEAPAASNKSHTVLKAGMVFTVEPAVYLPNWGGIRIEDMVLVTRKGCEILTDDIDKRLQKRIDY